MQERRRREVLRTLGLVSVAGLSSLAGCNGPSAEEPETTTETETETSSPTASTTQTPETETTTTAEPARTVTDVTGRTVGLPESVTRVVALGPGTLRTVAYLDAVDRVVGVERRETDETGPPTRPYLIANHGLTGRPTVAADGTVDEERLGQTDPQVVVRSFVSRESADELQSNLGVPVVAVRPGGLVGDARETFAASLRVVGRVLRQSTEAAQLLGYLEDAVGDLSSRAPDDAPDAYAGYVGPGGGLRRTQPAYAPFAFPGAGNVAADVAGGETIAGVRRATVPPERIVEWNPGYAFLDRDADSYDALGAERYGSVAAVESGNVFGVPPTLDYGVNAATALADAYYVGSVLFPSAYEDADPEARAEEIYDRFLGAPVYGELAGVYGGGFGRIDV